MSKQNIERGITLLCKLRNKASGLVCSCGYKMLESKTLSSWGDTIVAHSVRLSCMLGHLGLIYA